MSRSMVWWLSFMATMNTAVAGTILVDVIGQKAAGLLVLAVASLQAGTVAYQANTNRQKVLEEESNSPNYSVKKTLPPPVEGDDL